MDRKKGEIRNMNMSSTTTTTTTTTTTREINREMRREGRRRKKEGEVEEGMLSRRIFERGRRFIYEVDILKGYKPDGKYETKFGDKCFRYVVKEKEKEKEKEMGMDEEGKQEDGGRVLRLRIGEWSKAYKISEVQALVEVDEMWEERRLERGLERGLEDGKDAKGRNSSMDIITGFEKEEEGGGEDRAPKVRAGAPSDIAP